MDSGSLAPKSGMTNKKIFDLSVTKTLATSPVSRLPSLDTASKNRPTDFAITSQPSTRRFLFLILLAQLI